MREGYGVTQMGRELIVEKWSTVEIRMVGARGGLALEYVRSSVGGAPMITEAQMTLLPQLGAKAKGGGAEAQMIQRAKAKALENAVVTLLNMTIADKDGVIYAFGSAFSAK